MSNSVADMPSSFESRTEVLPGVTAREPAAELSAEDTTESSLRMMFALLLIALGLSTIAGCFIFKSPAGLQIPRRDALSSQWRT